MRLTEFEDMRLTTACAKQPESAVTKDGYAHTTVAYLKWDALENIAKTVSKVRDRRAVDNRFTDCGDGASTRILTLGDVHIEEDITYWWTTL